MSYNKLGIILNGAGGGSAGAGYSVGTLGGAGGGGIYGPPGQSYALTMEKVEAYDKFMRFLEINPDVAERYAVHNTYEILKNE